MNTNALEKIGEASQLPIQSESSAVLHMIERAARDPAVDMDKMLKLMAMRDQAELKQARRLFDESVAAAKAKIPPITRNATGHNNKKYADFAAIAAVVDPILGDNGLSYRFRTVQTDKAITVTCVLFGHGHSEENTLTAPPDNSGNKSPIHSMGSTLTYLQRYTLVQALGLAASNDDDGRAASNSDVITEKQADDLRDLMESVGADKTRFLNFFKVEKIDHLPVKRFQEAVTMLNAKQRG
jgi:hypothetical protein